MTLGLCAHPVDATTGPLYLDGRLPGVPFCSQECAARAVDNGDALARILAYVIQHEHPDDWGVPCVYTEGLRKLIDETVAKRIPSSTNA